MALTYLPDNVQEWKSRTAIEAGLQYIEASGIDILA